MQRWQWRRTVGKLSQRWTAAVALAVLALVPATAVSAADSVPLPFVEGEAARVVQGYNGGTHQGPSRFGLDLVLASGQTSGATVLSPFEGSIAWAFEPGDKTGCIEVLGRDGRLGVMLCHVQLDRPYRRGERVARGQVLGTVGAPGTVGNNGLAHVHMEIHQGGRGSNPVPFSGPEGMALEGVEMPTSGARNEHVSSAVLVSTNVIPPLPSATSAPAPANRSAAQTPAQPASAVQNATRCPAGETPRFTLGFVDLRAQLGEMVGDPVTCAFPDPNGTGDVQQVTTRGLAFWRKNTNTITFTNGSEFWGLTTEGWVSWAGESVDPPTDRAA